MFDFNDRRGAKNRVTGIFRKMGDAYHDRLMRILITPINPNAPHPMDYPDNLLSRSATQDPYEPNDVQKMYGMDRSAVKKMHKDYDFSTGLPIPKKALKRKRPYGF